MSQSSAGVTGSGAEPAALTAELRRVGVEAGLDAIGFASAEPFPDARRILEARRDAGLAAGMQFTYRNPARSTDPGRALPGARSLVVGARRYVRAEPAPDAGPPSPAVAVPAGGAMGRVARYAREDHYQRLRGSLEAVASRLRALGYRAVILVDDNALVDRAAAHRAGLGWFGKNTTLLLPTAGSWFVLGSVVTDVGLAPDTPVEDGCGSCRRCLASCPTGALVAPGVLDAGRCLAWLVQAPGVFPRAYRAALGDRIYGCDDCQEVCPVNVAATRRDPPPAAAVDAEATVDVLALLAASDEEILERWGRWYIAERSPRYLRRNALIILANTGDPDDPRVLDAVRAGLGHPDPLLRGHAVWAAARLGRPELARAAAGDSDPSVREEWESLGDVAASPAVAARRRLMAGGAVRPGSPGAGPPPGP